VHRQTNRHLREISQIVPAHTRVRAHAEITRTPLRICGGDECDVDSLSLIQIDIRRHTSIRMHVCLFVLLSIPDSADSPSLLIQSYIPACILCVFMYIFVHFFVSCSEYTLQLGA
jgi:hypothetical protein